MQIFKIVLLTLLITGLHAKDAKWQELKPLKAYASNAYRLKKGIEYLEIRTYTKSIEERTYNKKQYTVSVSMQKRALNSFDPKLIKRFKKLSPNLSAETNIGRTGICLMAGCASRIGNGFMIDSHGKIWRMNEIKDVIGMLGEIDTPAEVKVVLWLNDESRDIEDRKHKDKYQKTSSGYTVISEYDNSIMNLGECGHFTYRLKINQKGKITETKLLKKKPSKNGCIAMD